MVLYIVLSYISWFIMTSTFTFKGYFSHEINNYEDFDFEKLVEGFFQTHPHIEDSWERSLDDWFDNITKREVMLLDRVLLSGIYWSFYRDLLCSFWMKRYMKLNRERRLLLVRIANSSVSDRWRDLSEMELSLQWREFQLRERERFHMFFDMVY